MEGKIRRLTINDQRVRLESEERIERTQTKTNDSKKREEKRENKRNEERRKISLKRVSKKR